MSIRTHGGITIRSIPDVPTAKVKIVRQIRTLTESKIEEADELIKSLPLHISYDEIMAGHSAARGQVITLQDAVGIVSIVNTALQELGVKTEVIDPPEMSKSDIIPKKLAKLISHGKNVMLYGGKGTGKTMMATDGCILAGYEELVQDKDADGNLTDTWSGTGRVDKKRVKYFSMATLHPEDFVGIPAPDKREGHEAFFKYLMLEGIFDCEVLILDEFNRAHPKVINGVMQILHGRAINDMELTQLKSIIAMINPPDEGDYHGTDELDEAVMDRFDHYIEVKAAPNTDVLARLLGSESVAGHLVSWWKEDLKIEDQRKISPRRLEKIGRAWLDDEGTKETIYKKSAPISLHLLDKRLKELNVLTMDAFIKDPQKVIDEIKSESIEAKDLKFRARDIINQLHTKNDRKGMAKVAKVIEVLDRDMIKSIDRNPPLKKFFTESVTTYCNADEQKSITKSFMERAQGAAILRDRTITASEQLAQNQDSKTIRI